MRMPSALRNGESSSFRYAKNDRRFLNEYLELITLKRLYLKAQCKER